MRYLSCARYHKAVAKPLTQTPIPRKLGAKHVRQLRELVTEHGLVRVSNAAGIDSQTLTRVLANVTHRIPTTAALIAFLEAQS